MREILFRGKRVDSGEWVEGYYYKLGSQSFIRLDIHVYQVIPETVGQFTGLLDKNWVKIFEWDVLIAGNFDKKMLVIFRKDLASFAISADGWMYDHYFGEAIDPGNAQVIGNIHDNPELIGKEDFNG